MKRTAARVIPAQIFLGFVLSTLVIAQSTTTLSGTVKDAKGAPVPSAKVSLKNSSTGQTTEATADAQGAYHFADLAPGEYELTTSASGFETRTDIVHLQSAPQTEDVALTQTGGPSLSDLGFNTADTRGNTEEQARLDKRTRMLKIHQKMGLITAVPLAATIITGFGAGGHQTSSSTRDLHAALGGTTAALYFTTAYFAIRAPKISGTETRGPIRVHKALAWVHGTGMILTPILGIMAFQQKSRGEHIHGIAQAHGPVAIITGAAYGAALLSVSVKF
ncbi:MAG TPA: carboxypeptidase-like regulatory domain-containing protein [Terriglobales bacterium]|nr:carboxypeptidase-like regulatory domain-containing protein [Terriglobales bacterium]